jgi:hypothetical protein
MSRDLNRTSGFPQDVLIAVGVFSSLSFVLILYTPFLLLSRFRQYYNRVGGLSLSQSRVKTIFDRVTLVLMLLFTMSYDATLGSIIHPLSPKALQAAVNGSLAISFLYDFTTFVVAMNLFISALMLKNKLATHITFDVNVAMISNVVAPLLVFQTLFGFLVDCLAKWGKLGSRLDHLSLANVLIMGAASSAIIQSIIMIGQRLKVTQY